MGLKTGSSLRSVIKYLQTLVSATVTLTGTQTLTNKTITSSTASLTQVISTYAADGAIAIVPGIADIAKTSAAAMTIAAPTAGQNGVEIIIVNSTAFAHTVTFTGATLNNGTSSAKTTLTFPTYVGGSAYIVADNGKWYLNGLVSATVA